MATLITALTTDRADKRQVRVPALGTWYRPLRGRPKWVVRYVAHLFVMMEDVVSARKSKSAVSKSDSEPRLPVAPHPAPHPQTALVEIKAAAKPASTAKERPQVNGAPGDDIGAAELGRRVAENLRDRRKSRGMSLDDLARASGVSRAALSQVETCKSNPTVGLLWKIAVGLGVPFAELIGEQAPGVAVLRRADAQVLRSVDGKLESRPLAPAGASPYVELYELRLAARSTHASEAHAAGTHELLVVLSGTLRLRVGDESHELGTGDCVSFPADRQHAYENPGASEARYHNVIVYER